MDRNDPNPAPLHRRLGRLVRALSLAACTACGADDGPRTCDDIASAMIEQCADEYEAHLECRDEEFLPGACAEESRAEWDCLGEVRGELESDEFAGAYAVYMCEVAEEPGLDCDRRIAECT